MPAHVSIEARVAFLKTTNQKGRLLIISCFALQLSCLELDLWQTNTSVFAFP